jgi:hypothetical protein
LKITKGDYWEASANVFKIQVKTKIEQREIQEALPNWNCVSFGYIPHTGEDIYVFQKTFGSPEEWNNFLNSDRLKKLIEMREVTK